MINNLINWFINLSTTDFIALLAFIVALYGAILSTIIYNKEKLKINLKYLDRNFFSYQRDSELSKNNGFNHVFNKELYNIAILIRISNNSKVNTTINSFTFNEKYTVNGFTEIESFFGNNFYEKDNELINSSYLKFTNVLKPLITLQPFETVEGYIIFNNIKEIPSKFKLSINAVQKSKNYTLKLDLNNCTKIEEQAN